jgi:L-aminopeptidase/D-esterase-like protein
VPSLTDIPGIRVGHATDLAGLTGCTVVLCEDGAVAGVEIRGAAPGTRETSLLTPGALVPHVHGVLLTGGSAFGLAAADGVMRYLEERGIGFGAGVARVPIVPAAVLFDLGVGNPRARPDAAMGYAACVAAHAGPVEEGSVGVGTGATLGKVLGDRCRMKGGVGSWSIRLPEGQTVAALVVVNALGDVVDDETGAIIVGARHEDGRFARSSDAVLARTPQATFGANTTLAVIATDVVLSRDQTWRLAVQGHAGLSRTIVPSHTVFDGDTVFVLSTGTRSAAGDPAGLILHLGEAAARVTAASVKRAVRAAVGLGGVPCWRDVQPHG